MPFWSSGSPAGGEFLASDWRPRSGSLRAWRCERTERPWRSIRLASSSSSTKRWRSQSAPGPSCPSRGTGCAARTPTWKPSRSSRQSPASAQTGDRTHARIAPPSLRSRQRSRTPAPRRTIGRRSSSSPPRLGELGTPPAPPPPGGVSLRQARDDWLRRLEAQQKSKSALVAYRVAIDDLLDWSEASGRSVLEEATIVDYLRSYQQRARPAQATYYRRFLLLRRFLRWVSRGDSGPDPFLDLEPPPKPRQERDWLTPEKFRHLLDAAGRPERNLPGLAERDQLALLALVTTGLRRSELCALEWRDLELDGRE